MTQAFAPVLADNGGGAIVLVSSAAGRTAGAAMGGVVIMLIVAGVLEGFGRQLIQIDWARWSLAGVTLTIWLAYFYLPRRRTG